MPARTALKDTIVSADVDGEIVLLDLEAGTYFGLDEVGTAIWRQLGQGASDDEIVSGLLEAYDVDPAQLRSDVAIFLGRLSDIGLTVEIDG